MSNNSIKDYLGLENSRNKLHANLYTDLIQRALGPVDVLVGHHLCFEANHDISTENEIPSADTLLFDHDIMIKVFGGRAIEIMQRLAAEPAEQRDAILAAELNLRAAA